MDELLKSIKLGVKSRQSRAWLLERRFPMEFAISSQKVGVIISKSNEATIYYLVNTMNYSIMPPIFARTLALYAASDSAHTR